MPKKFTLKLTTEIQVTPDEFADALSDADQRRHWEPKLKSSKKKDGAPNLTLLVEYNGIVSAHEISYDFEMMSTKHGSYKQPLSSFMINEVTVMNHG